MINTNNDHSVVCSDAVANDIKNQQNSYITYLLHILSIKMNTLACIKC